jgi:hypothetical protein
MWGSITVEDNGQLLFLGPCGTGFCLNTATPPSSATANWEIPSSSIAINLQATSSVVLPAQAVEGGRIWVSADENPLSFNITPSGGFVEPSVSNPMVDGYNKAYNFIPLTYNGFVDRGVQPFLLSKALLTRCF